MGRYIFDENIVLQFVPTIADTDAPTLTELQAGEDCTGFIVEFETPDEGSTVDVPDPTSTWNKTTAGTRGGSISGQFYKDDDLDAGNTAWDTLPYGTTGFWVIREGQGPPSTALAVDDVVDVFPMDVHTRSRTAYRRNNRVVFDHGAGVPDTPTYGVAVVSGA